MRFIDRIHLGRAGRFGALDRGVRIVTINSIRTVAPPTDSGLKFACGGDSSETQNEASPTESWATRSGLSSVPPTR